MSKKINLGVKPENTDMVMESPTASQKPYYPSLYVEKELPIDGADVGKTLTAQVSVKVKSYTQNTKEKGKAGHSYQLDVLDIQFGGEDNGHITADPMTDRKMKY